MITFEDETRKTIRTDTKIISVVKQCIGCPYVLCVAVSVNKFAYYCNYKQQYDLIEDVLTVAEFCQLETHNE